MTGNQGRLLTAARRAAMLALVGSWLAASVASSTTLTRNPYVNVVTPSSASIAWKTDATTLGAVVYTKDFQSSVTVTEAFMDTFHLVNVTGLDPSTIYFYRVVAGSDTLTEWNDYFQTAPAPGAATPFTFAALGDLGTATTDQMDVAAVLNGFAPNFAILTGDIIYDAGEAANFDPQYFQIYQPTLATVPFYTSLGNHDLLTDNGQPYLDNFFLPTNSETNSERYYSFDYGNAHFVSLEVTVENTTPDAAMLGWLDADLAASTARWKFVFFHVPAYSNGGGHGGDPTIAAALEPIFMSRGVDIVFQGHNHFYTRTYPLASGAPVDAGQEPNYVNPGGPIWITTGGGGRALYALAAPSSLEAADSSGFHFVDVIVSGDVLGLVAVNSAGETFDEMGIVKTSTTAIELTGFEAIGEAGGVRLRWTRPDGGTDGGFNVYRALDAAGPWTRLNPELLRGSTSFEFLDADAASGVPYAYRLGLVDGAGRETAGPTISASRSAPLRFALERPRPNPTRGSSLIAFTLDQPAETRVVIVDVTGRLVRTLASRHLPAGAHALSWDGRDSGGREAASGIYFAVVRSGAHEARTRVALLR